MNQTTKTQRLPSQVRAEYKRDTIRKAGQSLGIKMWQHFQNFEHLLKEVDSLIELKMKYEGLVDSWDVEAEEWAWIDKYFPEDDENGSEREKE